MIVIIKQFYYIVSDGNDLNLLWFFAGKFVSPEMVARRVEKSGDGTHPLQQNGCVWGYGDSDICQADLQELEQMRT